MRQASSLEPAIPLGRPQDTTGEGPALRSRQASVPSRLMSRRGTSALSQRPIRPITAPSGMRPDDARVGQPEFFNRLREAHGDTWSFEIVQHSSYGNTVEVVGQLRANGTVKRETAVVANEPGRSLGELLERAANISLQKCADALMRNGR